MSIFGYPMDSWVHTGTLVFLSLRAREYTRGRSAEIALTILWSNPIGQAVTLFHDDCRVPMADAPFSGTLWLRNTNRYLVDSWVHRVPENGVHQPLGRGYLTWNGVQERVCHNIVKLNALVEYRVPMADVPFSGTLWTHESTQVLWCSWVLGQGSTEGRQSLVQLPNSVTRSFDHNIGQAAPIVNCRVPMADVHFRVPVWTHESTQVLWCSWVIRAREYTRGRSAVK